MTHPFDRKVFFVRQQEEFLSLNEVRNNVQTGKLSMFDTVFDTDGDSYTAESIALGMSPRWATTAEHDPMLHGIPMPPAEDIATVEELLLEEDSIEMPRESKIKSVSDYLMSEPRIARLVVNAERWTL